MELHREVELDVDDAEAWDLIADPARLAGWLGESVDVAIEPGATGTIVDDGIVRFVHIDQVDLGRRIEFTWWEGDGNAAGDVAKVTLDIEAAPAGSRLRITERVQFHDARLDLHTRSMARQLRWEARVCALWACTVAAALVS